MHLDVLRTHLHRRCSCPSPFRRHDARRRRTGTGIKDPAQVAPCLLTDQVGIIRWWADADRHGRSSEELAHVVREVLERVGRMLERRASSAVVERSHRGRHSSALGVRCLGGRSGPGGRSPSFGPL